MQDNGNPPKEVKKVLGNCNCIIVVPDGYPYGNRSNPLAVIGLAAREALQSYAVINTKYKKSITDLTNTELIRKNKRITNEFLLPFVRFKKEIRGNNQTPLIIILQAVNRSHLEREHIPITDIILGFGQGERHNSNHPHRPTFAPSIVNRFRLALADSHFNTELAPPVSSLCGHEATSINQLFSQKNYLEDLYDPNTSSLLLSIRDTSLTDNSSEMQIIGQSLAKAIATLTEQMPLVRKVKRSAIETDTRKDRKYIFRVQDDSDSSMSMLREAYISELAQSIQRSGLIHPLVLLQKEDGKYKILCGFRRFQALKSLETEWIEAKIYQESDFSKEDFFDISLAENTKRRNLNPIEIGNFLESAAQELSLNNANLAEKFGQTLGIGLPNQNVSQSTVHKYRKINAIRTRNESPEIINDIINEKLKFTIAAEILAPIKDPSDRNCFYGQILKPLVTTRAQTIKIKKLIEAQEVTITAFLKRKEVQKAVEKALQEEHKASHFIAFLQRKQQKGGNRKARPQFQKQVEQIRSSLFAKRPKGDFKIVESTGKKKEFTLQVKMRPENLAATIAQLKKLSEHEEKLKKLFDK